MLGTFLHADGSRLKPEGDAPNLRDILLAVGMGILMAALSILLYRHW